MADQRPAIKILQRKVQAERIIIDEVRLYLEGVTERYQDAKVDMEAHRVELASLKDNLQSLVASIEVLKLEQEQAHEEPEPAPEGK